MSYSAETGLSRLPKNITELPPSLPGVDSKFDSSAAEPNELKLANPEITDDGHLNLELITPTDGENKLASVEITGEAKLGFGFRGGLLNWLIGTVDVVSGAHIISKLARGETLEESDKLVLGGYLEMNAKYNNDPFTKMVGKILNAKGLNFDSGVTLRIELIGTGTDKMRLGKIVIETLAQAPQPRKTPGDYLNIAAMGNTLIYTFDENGDVDFDHKFYNLQAGVSPINAPKDFPDDSAVFNIKGTRGLFYGIFADDNFTTSVPAITQILSRGHIEDLFKDHNINQHKLADATNAGLFLIALGKALFGDGPQDGSEPDSMSFIGMARFVQAVDQFNASLPLSAPMFGFAGEGRITVTATNDGIPEIVFRLSGISEPILKISVQELKEFYQRTKELVEKEIGELLEHPVFNPDFVTKTDEQRAEEAFENNARPNPEGWQRPYPDAEELNPPPEDGSLGPGTYDGHQLGGPLEEPREPPNEPALEILSPQLPDGSVTPNEFEINQLGGGHTPPDVPPRPLDKNQETY